MAAAISGMRPAPPSQVDTPPNPVVSQAKPLTTDSRPPIAAGPQPAYTPQQSISAAQECERQGDIAKARQHYQQALATWPGNPEVLRAAARMEDRQGELPLAESLYHQAVSVNPQNAAALNDLGLCLARQGKLDASAQVLEQAIHLQPDKPLYRNNAATVLVEMRQDQRALGHLAAVHAPAEANYNFGQLLVQRGRGPDAVPYFQAAVDQNPQLQPARVALAQLQGRGVVDVTPMNASPAMSSPPAWSHNVQPQQAVPVGTQPASPQVAPQIGPQLNYPSAAWSRETGATVNVPPTYQPPTAPYATTGYPAHPADQVPRYLPPVASQPGAARR